MADGTEGKGNEGGEEGRSKGSSELEQYYAWKAQVKGEGEKRRERIQWSIFSARVEFWVEGVQPLFFQFKLYS